MYFSFVISLSAYMFIFSMIYVEGVLRFRRHLRTGIRESLTGANSEGGTPGKWIYYFVVALFMMLEVYVMSSWSAYCAYKTLHFLAMPEIEKRWLYYFTGFILCEIGLGIIIRRDDSRGMISVMRDVIPMGLYVTFCVHPYLLDAFGWIQKLVR